MRMRAGSDDSAAAVIFSLGGTGVGGSGSGGSSSGNNSGENTQVSSHLPSQYAVSSKLESPVFLVFFVHSVM